MKKEKIHGLGIQKKGVGNKVINYLKK